MNARYHRIDGWRGYRIPANAVAGVSDTGTAPDSPAPSDAVKEELRRIQAEALRPAGIRSRTKWGRTSNVFAAKRWLTVAEEDFPKAAALTMEWMDAHRNDTYYVHDADLGDLGYGKGAGYT